MIFLETVISEEVRAAAAHAANRAAQLATKSSVSDTSATSRSGSSRSGIKRALPDPSSFTIPASFYDDEDVNPANLM